MTGKCAKCGKKSVVGRQVTFSGKRGRRIFKPNLHIAWVMVGGQRVRRKFCTKCLRIVKKAIEPSSNRAMKQRKTSFESVSA